jgi:MFS family permease
MSAKPGAATKLSKRSLYALNAANFFQAELVGVVIPVLNAFLRERHWSYDAIGVATAAAGLGTLVLQIPAGWITDRVSKRRYLFAASAILTGVCLVLAPAAPQNRVWTDTLLFLSGAAQSFFPPLLGALALGLAGHRLLNRIMGSNQSWNHAGNIAAAGIAMVTVSALGLRSVFYSAGGCSLLAAAAVLLIRERDLDEQVARGLTSHDDREVGWRDLFRDRAIAWLFVSVFLFHLANAPILPTVALYVKKMGGSNDLMTATVLTAQIVMVPVAVLTGRLCDSWGRKSIMAVAFWVLPFRILSYTFASTARDVVYLQTLDGIGAGIYGVAIVAFSADLTRGKGHFNSLMGLFATALAVGGVAGPVLSGLLVQNFGFANTFLIFTGISAAGAVTFSTLVPETKGATSRAIASAVPRTER